MNNNNKRKSANRMPLTREEELLLKTKTKRIAKKKVTSLSSSGRESHKAQAIMELRHKFDLNIL
jgi:hypothetical protein